MTIGEVEEFLWSLSTTLEGEIGNWQIRYNGALVSVRVDPATDGISIRAPIAFPSAPALRDHTSSVGVRYVEDGSKVHAAFAAQLSPLTMNGLQAAFQQVVDQARQRPGER